MELDDLILCKNLQNREFVMKKDKISKRPNLPNKDK